MNSLKTYSEPKFNKKEILRYAGCRGEDNEISRLIDVCIDECRGVLEYKVCFDRFPVHITENIVDLSFTSVQSRGLEKNLADCHEIVLFAATIGIGIDRVIMKYNRSMPAKALIFQAIGAERIESLCDCFNSEITHNCAVCGLFTRHRFSPGYGDLPLDIQRNIFSVLDCPRKIGLTLNDSLLMTPTKSVTAIIGISRSCGQVVAKRCKSCEKTDCKFRRRDTD